MHTGRLPRSWPLNTNEEIQQTHSTENILPHGYWRISMLWHPSEASHLLHVKQESDLPLRKRTRSDVQSATAPRLSLRASWKNTVWSRLRLPPNWDHVDAPQWTLEGLCSFFSGFISIWVYDHKPIWIKEPHKCPVARVTPARRSLPGPVPAIA